MRVTAPQRIERYTVKLDASMLQRVACERAAATPYRVQFCCASLAGSNDSSRNLVFDMQKPSRRNHAAAIKGWTPMVPTEAG